MVVNRIQTAFVALAFLFMCSSANYQEVMNIFNDLEHFACHGFSLCSEILELKQRIHDLPSYIKYFEIHNETNHDNGENTEQENRSSELTSKQHHSLGTRSIPRQKNDKTCPKINVSHDKYINQLSISPWKYIITVRHERKPKYLVETRCLCEGCIDPDTLEEDKIHFRSSPIYITTMVERIRTNMRNKTIRKEIQWGCRCDRI